MYDTIWVQLKDAVSVRIDKLLASCPYRNTFVTQKSDIDVAL